MESNLLVSSKSKHTGTAQPGSPAPRSTPRGTEDTGTHKNTHKSVGIIHKNQRIDPSVHQQMNEQTKYMASTQWNNLQKYKGINYEKCYLENFMQSERNQTQKTT